MKKTSAVQAATPPQEKKLVKAHFRKWRTVIVAITGSDDFAAMCNAFQTHATSADIAQGKRRLENVLRHSPC